MSVNLGAVYPATYPATTAGSSAILTVTAPDGTTTTPTVTVTATAFTATVPAAQVGASLLVWAISGAITDVLTDQFTAVTAGLSLISLGDLKDQLNIATLDTSGTARLRRFMQSASDVVQNITGPILPQTKTRVFPGGSSWIVIPDRFVQSITSITEFWGGTTIYTLTEQPPGTGPLTAFGYTFDRSINKIVRQAAGYESNFKLGQNAVTVVYVSGMTTIPQDITDATGELIRHWWSHGQQPQGGVYTSTSGGDDAGTVTVMGYSVPNRVVEMLTPYRRTPGVY